MKRSDVWMLAFLIVASPHWSIWLSLGWALLCAIAWAMNAWKGD